MSEEYEMANPSDEEIISILYQRLQTTKEENEKLKEQSSKVNCIGNAISCPEKYILTQKLEKAMENLKEMANYMKIGCKGKHTEANFLDDCFTMGFCTNQCVCYLIQQAEKIIKELEK